MAILLPELVYLDDGFVSNTAVEIEEGTGRITRIMPAGEIRAGELLRAGPAAELGQGEVGGAEYISATSDGVVRLRDCALMPGFVNAHSHAFQRLLRGRTHWRTSEVADPDFWSWRELMYACALSLTPDEIFAVSRFCFLEMLRAGYTTVGEFHYLQRDQNGEAYANANELAERVIAAAREVGIRISLLNVCYAEGGVGRPLLPEQRRFATPDLDTYLLDTERLVVRYAKDPLVTVGTAPHSVRAVAREWLLRIRDFAAGLGLPLHMHVSEQPAEVEACVAKYGKRPVELLADDEVLSPRFTGVHCTHVLEHEINLLADARATVCACPTTERDLGDGIMPAREMVRAGVPIAIGTDSQTIIAPLEEIRALEYHERLRSLRRVALTRPGSDGRHEVAPVLIASGTSAGARSLGIDAGAIRAGALADLVAIDIRHISLLGVPAPDLAAALALSGSPDVVRDVWVAGKHVVKDRRHARDSEAARDFERIFNRTDLHS
jgi:formimidoylglutamate deiminase